jgi:hypothetical protein
LATISEEPDAKLSASERFTTATCGAAGKFAPRRGRDYVALLEARYAARDGRHIHIGPIDNEPLEKIDALLARIGRRGDFVHIPFVPHLSVALAIIRPDLYVGSYPMGGKRASVEAMAAGSPFAAWQKEGYHSAAEGIYREHLRWDDLDDLSAIIAGFTARQRSWHAIRSRRFFDRFHSQHILKQRLADLLSKGAGSRLERLLKGLADR